MATIPVIYLKGYLSVCVHYGIPAVEAIDAAGINSQILNQKDALVDITAVKRLLNYLVAKSGDPAFGLQTGPIFLRNFLAMTEDAVLNAQNMRTIWNFAAPFQSLFLPGFNFSLSEQEGSAKLSVNVSPDIQLSNLELITITEIALSALTLFNQQLLGNRFQLEQAHFIYEKPSHHDAYNAFFQCPLYFKQTTNALFFSSEMLDTPLLGTLPNSNPKAIQSIEKSLTEQLDLNELMDQVLNFIKNHIQDEDLSIDSIASHVRIPKRTLQRKLSQANFSINQIKDDIRQVLAFDYLRETSYSNEEIAHRLGYSEASAFNNAFKRWTNTTPTEYRRNHGNSSQK